MLANARRLLLGAILFVLTTAIGDTAQAARTWREYTTENFIVYSDTNEKEGRALVEDLEYFRHYLQIFTSGQNTLAPVPLTVYAFHHRKSFKKEFRTKNITGFYFDRPSGAKAYVSLNKSRGTFAQTGRHVLFHEYVHYFVRQFSPYHYPSWFDEGLAEFLGSFARKKNKMEFGNVPNFRFLELSRLKWLATRELISANRHKINDPVFYAQSWLTVHYLQNSPLRNAQLNKYVEALNAGELYDIAFSSSFDIEIEELDSEIKAYWKSRKLKYVTVTVKKVDFTPSIAVRELSPTEALLMLARAQLDRNHNDKSTKKIKGYTTKVLKSEPQNITALALRIELNIKSGNLEGARAQLDAWPEPQRASHRGLLLQGKIHLAEAIRVENGNRYFHQLELAAQAFHKALQLKPDDPETLYSFGHSAARSNSSDPMSALKALIKARDLLPQNEEIERTYAMAALKAGYAKQAAEIFQDYLNWSSDGGLRRWAQDNLDAANAQIEAEAEAD